MPTIEDSISSSPGVPTDSENSLAYYKSQYEQLEAELADFQTSSKELEAELEKDVEAAERRERQLQEKVEGLGFEVEEWKVSWLNCGRRTCKQGTFCTPDLWLVSNVRTGQIQAIEG